MWIDTHTHLNVTEFDQDRAEVMHRCTQSEVLQVLIPNIDISTIQSMSDIGKKFPNHVKLMMGMHPCSIGENYLAELELIKNELFSGSFIGVGEIGIDLYWNKTTFDLQKDAFIKQLEWASLLDLPVSIHSRDATSECIEIIKSLNKDIKGVFHCFGGTVDQAIQIIKMGMYLGVGGVVTYKKSLIPEVLLAVGLENVVLESDSPYLSPVPYRGKRNESSFIPIIGKAISEILNIHIKVVEEVTTNNAKKVFKI
ncbi:MAG: TatD family hydrolase [Saprospiraceae bacterium]|nr:TatD family hydrolase [Saprospiraceae bacterium]